MCLAKAYFDTAGQSPSAPVMENVTRVVVEGETVRLTSLFGQTQTFVGRIESIDFGEGRLVLGRSPQAGLAGAERAREAGEG